MRVRRIIPLVVLALAACAGDSTGPKSLTGSWTYVAKDLSSPILLGLSCGVSGMVVELVQSGSTVTGTTTSGTLRCIAPVSAKDTTYTLPAQTVEGSVDGSAVTLDMGTMHHVGTVNGGTVSGTVTLTLDLPIPFMGTFTLTRK